MDLKYSQVKQWLPVIEAFEVSSKARSQGQIVEQLKKAKNVSSLPREWREKREGFLARTLPQYQEAPSVRRYLALIAWAYMPERRPKNLAKKIKKRIEG